MRRALFASLYTLGLATARVASAQSNAQADAATAEVLFREGVAAMKAGDYETACPKLAESQRLDRGIGTPLYLGDCYEHLGRVASAWAAYREAEDIATRAGDGRAGTAHDLAKKLEPKLSTLTIRIPRESRATGLSITRDGTPIAEAVWDVDAPVDPGEHVVVADAPGKRSWTGRVTVAPDAGHATLVVGPLADAPKSAGGEYVRTSGTAFRVVGISLLGVAAAGIAIGAAYGVITLNKSAQLKSDCAASSCTTDDAWAVALHDEAVTARLVSTVAFIGGGAALVGGLVFLLTAPKDRVTRLAFAPYSDGTGAGLFATGTF